MTTLHLIAETPSHGDRHVDPVNPRELSRHTTREEARAAGRAYLRQHPAAWVQIDDGQGGAVEDVTAD